MIVANQHVNTAIEGHPMIGTEHAYRPDLPPYDGDTDRTPGMLIVGTGMPVRIRAVFTNWNGLGNDMLYVYCDTTGQHTHVSPRELTGWEPETLGSLTARTFPPPVCDGLPLDQTTCSDKAAHV